MTWREATVEEQAKQRRYYPMMTRANILDKIVNENLRLVDLDTRPHDNYFAATMEIDDSTDDWWVHDATKAELDDFIDQYGARVLDLEVYGDPNNPTYDALLRPNTDELTHETNMLMRSLTGGDSGFYQTIGHVPQTGIRQDQLFESADAFGLFYLTAAMDGILFDDHDLDSYVAVREGSGGDCPDNAGDLSFITYREALRRTVQDNDRQAAKAVYSVVGWQGIEDMFNDNGAAQSHQFHELGCYDNSVRNFTTLEDADAVIRYSLLSYDMNDDTIEAWGLLNDDLNQTLAGNITFQSVLDLALSQADMPSWDKDKFRNALRVKSIAGTYDNYSDPSRGPNTSRFTGLFVPIKLEFPLWNGGDLALTFGSADAYVNKADNTWQAETAVGLAVAKLFRNHLDYAIESWESYPTPCPADVNNDGFIDAGDITAFIDAFLLGEMSTDLNNDGFIDAGDISAFTDYFLNGCED